MKTKVAYVLVSNQNDIYLEQLYFSMYSLRMHNPHTEILIICDSATNESLVGNRKLLSEISDKIISVDVPLSYNNMQKSRFIKTSLRKHVQGDYVYIDNDTIITDELTALDRLEYPLMGVPDFHCDIESYPGKKDYQIFSSKVNLCFEKHKYCFNGGVMYVKDDPISYQLYELWNREWIANLDLGYSTDQQSLFAANEKCGFPIKVLDDIYNCQIMYNGLKYLYKAKIIHYFASSFEKSASLEQPYIFQNYKHLKYLKDNAEIDDECIDGLTFPKGAFIDNVQIVTSFQSAYNNTPFYSLTRNFYYSHPKVIKFFSKIKKLLKR